MGEKNEQPQIPNFFQFCIHAIGKFEGDKDLQQALAITEDQNAPLAEVEKRKDAIGALIKEVVTDYKKLYPEKTLSRNYSDRLSTAQIKLLPNLETTYKRWLGLAELRYYQLWKRAALIQLEQVKDKDKAERLAESVRKLTVKCKELEANIPELPKE